MGQRTWGPKGQVCEQAPPLHVYFQIYSQVHKQYREVPSFHKFQQFIDWLQILQPEMKSNDYSNSTNSLLQ